VESLLLLLLTIWILGWSVYCVVEIAGVDLGISLSQLLAYGWTLLLIPAAYAACLLARRLHPWRGFSPGDHVVYLVQKYSPRPGPRAERIQPAPIGEGYNYMVRKFWTVAKVVGPDLVEVVTNGGKHRIVRTDDPRLRKPGCFESFILRYRAGKQFPGVSTQVV
jgi:hypothetical protein